MQPVIFSPGKTGLPSSNNTTGDYVGSHTPLYPSVDLGADIFQPDVQDDLQIALGVAVVLAAAITTTAILVALWSLARRRREKLGDTENDNDHHGLIHLIDASHVDAWSWPDPAQDALNLHSINRGAPPPADLPPTAPTSLLRAPVYDLQAHDSTTGVAHRMRCLSLHIPAVPGTPSHSPRFVPIPPSQLSRTRFASSRGFWTWPWSRREDEDEDGQLASPADAYSPITSVTPSTVGLPDADAFWAGPEFSMWPPPYHYLHPSDPGPRTSTHAPGGTNTPTGGSSLPPGQALRPPMGALATMPSDDDAESDEDEMPLAETQQWLLRCALAGASQDRSAPSARPPHIGTQARLVPGASGAGASSCPASPPPSYQDSVFA